MFDTPVVGIFFVEVRGGRRGKVSVWTAAVMMKRPKSVSVDGDDNQNENEPPPPPLLLVVAVAVVKQEEEYEDVALFFLI